MTLVVYKSPKLMALTSKVHRATWQIEAYRAAKADQEMGGEATIQAHRDRYRRDTRNASDQEPRCDRKPSGGRYFLVVARAAGCPETRWRRLRGSDQNDPGTPSAAHTPDPGSAGDLKGVGRASRQCLCRRPLAHVEGGTRESHEAKQSELKSKAQEFDDARVGIEEGYGCCRKFPGGLQLKRGGLSAQTQREIWMIERVRK